MGNIDRHGGILVLPYSEFNPFFKVCCDVTTLMDMKYLIMVFSIKSHLCLPSMSQDLVALCGAATSIPLTLLIPAVSEIRECNAIVPFYNIILTLIFLSSHRYSIGVFKDCRFSSPLCTANIPGCYWYFLLDSC